jgi:hypothetical protein
LEDAFENEIDQLRERIFPLARFLHALAGKLESPALIKRPEYRGFRFKNPGLVHFCLLRGVRIVSALNAAIELTRCGFTQEIVVLLRTVSEYSSQADFMLASRDEDGNLNGDASAFLLDYFADQHRGTSEHNTKRKKLVQKKVHQKVAGRLDSFDDSTPDEKAKRKPTDKLLSDVYLNFSNYVHGRYPESMDLYGGTPGRFHLTGMRRTPKDGENIAILDTMIKSASNCFIGMVQELQLYSLLATDPMLERWYREAVDGRAD